MAWAQRMPVFHSQSIATIRRLCGRLLVVVALWVVWPGPFRAEAVAALCACLAVGCGVAAGLRKEPFMSAALNRWFEAVILVLVAALIVIGL